MASISISSAFFHFIETDGSGVPASIVLDVGVPGPQGPAGPTGPVGPQGDPGPAGPGVPAGGLDGQILVKASDLDYDTAWIANYATELRIIARNETGSILPKGSVVYINGASGNKPTLAKAIATGDATSAQTLGMVSADIPDNQNGEVTVRGLLAGLDTSAYLAGSQLYLSGTTPGGVTTTKPVAPIHLVYVGIVTRQHATQGQVEVAVQNGVELDEVHDVLIVAPSNGQVLKYDGASGLWKNQTDLNSGVWGQITGTISSQTDLQSALSAKAPISNPIFSGTITNQGASAKAELLSSYFRFSNPLIGTQFTLVADNVIGFYNAFNDPSVTFSPLGLELKSVTGGPPATITFPDLSVQTTAWVGSLAWGQLTGTLSDQTDLQTELDLKANLSGAAFTGKISGTSVSGQAGVNIGIGGTSVDATTPGDLWITTSGSTLNYRDGLGSWRIVASRNLVNTFTNSQIITASDNGNPMLSITQTGNGGGLRITNDGTGNTLYIDNGTPDVPFAINADGKVGIGVPPNASAALNVDVNGIRWNTGAGTIQAIAAPVSATGTYTLEIPININGVNYRIPCRQV